MGIIWTPCTTVSTVQTPSTPDDSDESSHAYVHVHISDVAIAK